MYFISEYKHMLLIKCLNFLHTTMAFMVLELDRSTYNQKVAVSYTGMYGKLQ